MIACVIVYLKFQSIHLLFEIFYLDMRIQQQLDGIAL